MTDTPAKLVDTPTPTYGFTQPEVGGSDDTWGTKLNLNWRDIDALLTAAFEGGASAPANLGKLRTAFAKMATVDEAKTGAADRFLSPALAKETINVYGMPIGSIIMFDGDVATLPSNWAVCDGTVAGAPDLRDKFVVGASATKAAKSTGGKAKLTDVPKHGHGKGSLSIGAGGSHSHGINDPGHRHQVDSQAGVNAGQTRAEPFEGQNNTGPWTGMAATGITIQAVGDHGHALNGEIAETGTDGGVDITPPYYAVIYIKRMS